ncbi:MAG TPA: HAD family phosphatase [Steroidobacteraceae bacterium]|jgi:putative hydrolase of the HAD superfamily|nr:HAD family phosphatase [Steroidobacteraceae bacterium]
MALAVRNVIFDLGGVVLDWNPDHIVSRVQPVPELQAALKEALFGHADWRMFDRGTLTEPELIRRLQLRLGSTEAEVEAILDAVRNSLVEKPETLELMRTLQERGTPLYCLSNMPATIYTHLRQRHGFWDVFSGIVISGEVQMMKPEPEVFMHLLATFGLRAEESVFIDDLPANIESARQVGLHAICFKDAAQCRRELDQILGS